MEQNNKFRRFPQDRQEKKPNNGKPFNQRFYNNNNNDNNRQYKNERGNHDHFSCGHAHNHTFLDELWCHIPFSVFSLIISFLIVSIFFYIIQPAGEELVRFACHNLFHLTHYVHIFLAAINATIWTFSFSSRYKFISFLVGIFITIIFCIGSDILLPYLGLKFLGYQIPLHICFLDIHDTSMLGCFLLLSFLVGYALCKGNKKDSERVKPYIHFFHVFFSAMSALLYITSYTSSIWIYNSGIVILLLFICVLIPCTISDFLFPWIYTCLSVKKNNVYLKRN